VLSGRGLGDGLISRPEATDCGGSVCDHDDSIRRSPWPTGGGGLLCRGKESFLICYFGSHFWYLESKM
jgi:hypothetical protein